MDSGSGNNVRIYRLLKGITLRELADRMGVSKSRVAQIERSDNCTVDTVRTIAEALGVPPGDLITPSRLLARQQITSNDVDSVDSKPTRDLIVLAVAGDEIKVVGQRRSGGTVVIFPATNHGKFIVNDPRRFAELVDGQGDVFDERTKRLKEDEAYFQQEISDMLRLAREHGHRSQRLVIDAVHRWMCDSLG